MTARFLLPLLFLVAAPGARAEMSAHGGSPRCDEPQFACAVEATPAFAADGTLWLAWTSAGRVWAARSRDAGASFSSPVQITREPVRLDHAADARPQIVVDNEGGITIGFAVMTEIPFHGDVLYAHSGDGGLSWSSPAPVSAHPAGKRFLALARDPGGGIFATWVDKRDLAAAQAAGRDYAGAAVYAAWARDGGASFGEPLVIREHTCECCRVAVDFAGAGRPVVLWRNLFGKARDHAIATFEAPASPGPARRVSEDDWEIEVCPHHGPSLAVAPDGRYHVAWFTASARRQGLFYARSDDAGRSFGTPMRIGEPSRQPARPQLLAANGRIWLAWREYDGRVTEVVAMESATGGRDWSGRRVIARSSGSADHPLLVSNGRDVFISWLTRDEGYRLLRLDPGTPAARDD